MIRVNWKKKNLVRDLSILSFKGKNCFLFIIIYLLIFFNLDFKIWDLKIYL